MTTQWDYSQFDDILSIIGVSDVPDTNAQLIENSLSDVPAADRVKVDLFVEKHIFRHAREVQKGSRGGYLQASVTLPPDARTRILNVELSVVPSTTELSIHPHLLHLTVFTESQKRASYKTPLKSAADWRMKFVVEYGRKIYHIPNYGAQTKVCLPDSCLETKNGRTHLLLGNNKLLINIISSLQNSSKKQEPESDVITNLDVIKRRIEDERPELKLQGDSKELAKKMAAQYAQKDFKVELHRCKLRANIFDANLSDSGVSGIISNARDKNVGYLGIHSISDPGCCCSQGGWKLFLISQHKLARDKTGSSNKNDSDDEQERLPPVVPKLVVVDKDKNIAPGNYPINQILTDSDHFEVHGDAFSVTMPPQNPAVLQQLKQTGYHLRIFLYRSLDNMYSTSSIKFEYISHDAFEGDCPFCLIKQFSQNSHENMYEVPSNAGRRPRKRAKKISGSVPSPTDSYQSLSPYSDYTSGVSSPGVMSSPEHTPNSSSAQFSSQVLKDNPFDYIYKSTSGNTQGGVTWVDSNVEMVDANTYNFNSIDIGLPDIDDIGSLIFVKDSDLNVSNDIIQDSASVRTNEVVGKKVAKVPKILEEKIVDKSENADEDSDTDVETLQQEFDRAMSEAFREDEPVPEVKEEVPEHASSLHIEGIALSAFFALFAVWFYYYGSEFLL